METTNTAAQFKAGQLTVRKTGMGIFLAEVKKLDDDHFAEIQVGRVETEGKANEIVRAVNAHDRLTKALDQIAKLYEENREEPSFKQSQMLYDARCIARTALDPSNV